MFKKIVIIFSIITIFCTTYSFGADSDVFVSDSLIESYQSRIDSVSKRFKISVLNNSATREKIPDLITNLSSLPYCYVSNNTNIIYVYGVSQYNNGTDSTYTTYDGNVVPSREITINYYVSIHPRTGAFTIYTTSTTFNMPVALAQRSFYEVFGDGLYLYYREFTSSSASLSDVKESIDQQTEVIQDQNEFLQDTTIDDNDVSLPSFEVTDITADISDDIFETLMFAFIDPSVQTISFSLFNHNITLSSNATSNLLNTIDATLIKNIINSAWYFIFAYFIFQDINRYIEKIKSADILTSKTDTNIKANML